ncbi:pre-rRNA-processing protein TSR1 homolog isoform X1 [Haliotis rufescens]|uniref:pre-rRNA-processing protein TSR1 homolog isoform X1 n=1 Tax=Haliotis rufescens TaxID=6454 RepID=UPI00201ED0C1|nr:pre-rRNA-processing protein TSR1 homolog isoform X1 [Haliotis rufescens]
MAVEPQKSHRPGPLKQQNKAHKHGKHKSKGQLERETKGRVNVKVLSKRSRQSMKKAERRNQALQMRKQKRDEVLEKKRNRGGTNTPPHFVVVVSLDRNIDTKVLLDLLKIADDSAVVKQNEQGILHLSIPRFKQRVSIFTPEYGNLYALLDAAKIADTLLCAVSTDNVIDKYGEHCLSCLYGQGMPAAVFVCNGFKSLPMKKQAETRKLMQRKIEKRFPAEKFHSLDTSQDALLVVRQITNQKLRNIQYRDVRPHLIGEEISFELDNTESDTGTLKVTGYLRGKTLTVNRLVHIPGWGDFQMLQIDAPDDPYPLNLHPGKQNRKTQDVEMESEDPRSEVNVLERCEPGKQESLDSEVLPDPMMGEQTWPTEEELAEAESESKRKIVKRVPKGTSDYQAAWIIDSDEEEGDDSEEESDEEMDADMEAQEENDSSEEEDVNDDDDKSEYETVTIAEDDASKYDAAMDLDEDMQMLAKLKEEKQHVMFPDEVDTPANVTARTRFARFRGLKSFRTSPWDPKENLPSDFARIFQFENFKRTKKRCIEEDLDEGAMPGWYITVHVANVPKAFIEGYQPGSPVVLFGLLPHEHKVSVVHFVVKKCAEVDQPIRSKDRLIFHVGYRRFSANPIFSQHTLGSKHKFERFMPTGTAVVATVYAPILFPPSPVLVFQEVAYGEQSLVATGTLLSVNPDRIIAKRAVLSGYPFKINKRSAVIRYMFFNREDIMWFKPVELRTKWGRRGHIKEPLGTHGHMKCVFDGKMKSQDTILMNLYKRMYPKWTYNPHVTMPVVVKEYGAGDMESDDKAGEGAAYQMFE